MVTANTIFRLRGLLLLLLSFLSLTSALNLGRDPSTSLASDSLFKRVDGDEEYESCPRSCAPRVDLEGASEQVVSMRKVASQDERTTSKLTGRDMTLPEEGKMEEFMLKEVPKAQSIVWQNKGDDKNTAVTRSFASSRRGFSLGTMGLCGCTSVWIVSRSGVYASHFWESIAFSPDPIWKINNRETNTQVFERTVINPIQNGAVNADGRKMQDKVDPAVLGNDDSVRAYIVHPERSCYANRPNAYRPKWDQIKQTIATIIPALGQDDRWTEITYTRKDRDDPDLFTSSSGRVLFKYDPKHKGKKKATLWVEGREEPYHDDEW